MYVTIDIYDLFHRLFNDSFDDLHVLLHRRQLIHGRCIVAGLIQSRRGNQRGGKLHRSKGLILICIRRGTQGLIGRVARRARLIWQPRRIICGRRAVAKRKASSHYMQQSLGRNVLLIKPCTDKSDQDLYRQKWYTCALTVEQAVEPSSMLGEHPESDRPPAQVTSEAEMPFPVGVRGEKTPRVSFFRTGSSKQNTCWLPAGGIDPGNAAGGALREALGAVFRLIWTGASCAGPSICISDGMACGK